MTPEDKGLMTQQTQPDQPDIAKVITELVHAGRKTMYNEKVFKDLKDGLTNDQMPIPNRLAAQTAGLIKLLDDRAQGSIPKKAIIPAGTAILLDMADFVKKANIADPTEQDIKTAISLLVKTLLQVYGVAQKLAAGKQNQQPAQQPAQPQPAQPQGGLINAGA